MLSATQGSEKIRQDQLDAGRRMTGTLSVPRRGESQTRREPYVPAVGQSQKRHVPKGHDRILDIAQKASDSLFVVVLASGEQIAGRLVGRDKFTVTVQVHSGIRKTVFKHAIDLFYEEPKEGSASTAAEEGDD